MTCDVYQNRLLALPNPAKPSAELRAHLNGCPACRAVQAEAVRVEALVTRLPVPSSEARKAAFLESLTIDGPVIRSKPVLPSSLAASGTFRPVGTWLKRIDLRWAGGVAAALLVAVTAWWAVNRPKPPVPEVAEKPRHELLARSVKHTTALANSPSAPTRLTVFTNWSIDIQAEACAMSNAAPAEEMNSLARQYERAVNEGVLKQARQLKDQPMAAGERRQLLDEAITKLTAAETEASKLVADARKDAQPALGRIVESARLGRISLTRIAEGRDGA